MTLKVNKASINVQGGKPLSANRLINALLVDELMIRNHSKEIDLVSLLIKGGWPGEWVANELIRRKIAARQLLYRPYNCAITCDAWKTFLTEEYNVRKADIWKPASRLRLKSRNGFPRGDSTAPLETYKQFVGGAARPDPKRLVIMVDEFLVSGEAVLGAALGLEQLGYTPDNMLCIICDLQEGKMTGVLHTINNLRGRFATKCNSWNVKYGIE